MRCTLLLTLIALSSTLTGQDIIQLPKKRSIKKINLEIGQRELAIEMTDGSYWDAFISIPSAIRKDSVDLILALHWGVFSPRMNNRFLECLILPSIDTSKYLILAPDANHQAWWEAPKEVQLVRLLEQTKRNWPVKNIITIGYSDGGTGSAFLLCNYPELIDAALPIAGYYFEGCTYSNPTYVIHGIRDEVFNYSRSHNIMERAQDNSGSNLLFNAIENLTHTQPCLYIPHVRKGMEWIEARLKSKAFHP